MSVERPNQQDKKPERMLAVEKGDVMPRFVSSTAEGFQYGKTEVAFSDLDQDMQSALLEARAATRFGAEPSENLVAEIRTEWWKTLGTRVGLKPNQNFHLSLVGDKGNRTEAVANGVIVGNKLKEIRRVEGVVVNAGEVKTGMRAVEPGTESSYRGRPLAMTVESAQLLSERGCPQELVDDLNKLYGECYDSQMNGVFRLSGVFVDPKTDEYVLRGSVEWKGGMGWDGSSVENR